MSEMRRVTGEYVGEIGRDELFGKPFLCVYGKTKPRYWDENVIERQIADGLTAYVRFEATDKVNQIASANQGIPTMGTITAKKEHLKFLGIDEETLFRQANDGMSVTVESFGRFFRNMGLPFPECYEPPIYIVRSRKDNYGAGAIASDAVLKHIYEKMGAFTILPCSIHELIVMPQKIAEQTPDLTEMVREVNGSAVEERDQLSDNVYEYDETGLHKA